MSPTLIRSIRAHLMIASLAATVMDAGTLASMYLFDISASTFETPEFRIGVVAGVAIATALVRLLALAAYRLALRQQRAIACTDDPAVHDAYRFRALVRLHCRLSGLNEAALGHHPVLV